MNVIKHFKVFYTNIWNVIKHFKLFYTNKIMYSFTLSILLVTNKNTGVMLHSYKQI